LGPGDGVAVVGAFPAAAPRLVEPRVVRVPRVTVVGAALGVAGVRRGASVDAVPDHADGPRAIQTHAAIPFGEWSLSMSSQASGGGCPSRLAHALVASDGPGVP